MKRLKIKAQNKEVLSLLIMNAAAEGYKLKRKRTFLWWYVAKLEKEQ